MGKKEEFEQGVKDGQRGGSMDDLAQGVGNVNSPYGEGYKYGAEHRYSDQGQRLHSYDNTGVNDATRSTDQRKSSGQSQNSRQAQGEESFSGSGSSYSYSDDDHSSSSGSSAGIVGGVAATILALSVAGLIYHESLPSTRSRALVDEAFRHYSKHEYIEAVKDLDAAEEIPGASIRVPDLEERSLELLLEETKGKINNGKFGGTLKSLELYLEHKPNDLKALEYKAEVLTRKGKNVEALRVTYRILDQEPNNVRVLQLTGLNLAKGFFPDQAIPVYDRVLQLKPGDQWTTDARKKAADRSIFLKRQYLLGDIMFWGSVATFMGFFAWMFGTVVYEQWKNKREIKAKSRHI